MAAAAAAAAAGGGGGHGSVYALCESLDKLKRGALARQLARTTAQLTELQGALQRERARAEEGDAQRQMLGRLWTQIDQEMATMADRLGVVQGSEENDREEADKDKDKDKDKEEEEEKEDETGESVVERRIPLRRLFASASGSRASATSSSSSTGEAPMEAVDTTRAFKSAVMDPVMRPLLSWCSRDDCAEILQNEDALLRRLVKSIPSATAAEAGVATDSSSSSSASAASAGAAAAAVDSDGDAGPARSSRARKRRRTEASASAGAAAEDEAREATSASAQEKEEDEEKEVGGEEGGVRGDTQDEDGAGGEGDHAATAAGDDCDDDEEDEEDDVDGVRALPIVEKALQKRFARTRDLLDRLTRHITGADGSSSSSSSSVSATTSDAELLRRLRLQVEVLRDILAKVAEDRRLLALELLQTRKQLEKRVAYEVHMHPAAATAAVAAAEAAAAAAADDTSTAESAPQGSADAASLSRQSTDQSSASIMLEVADGASAVRRIQPVPLVPMNSTDLPVRTLLARRSSSSSSLTGQDAASISSVQPEGTDSSRCQPDSGSAASARATTDRMSSVLSHGAAVPANAEAYVAAAKQEVERYRVQLEHAQQAAEEERGLNEAAQAKVTEVLASARSISDDVVRQHPMFIMVSKQLAQALEWKDAMEEQRARLLVNAERLTTQYSELQKGFQDFEDRAAGQVERAMEEAKNHATANDAELERLREEVSDLQVKTALADTMQERIETLTAALAREMADKARVKKRVQQLRAVAGGQPNGSVHSPASANEDATEKAGDNAADAAEEEQEQEEQEEDAEDGGNPADASSTSSASSSHNRSSGDKAGDDNASQSMVDVLLAEIDAISSESASLHQQNDVMARSVYEANTQVARLQVEVNKLLLRRDMAQREQQSAIDRLRAVEDAARQQQAAFELHKHAASVTEYEKNMLSARAREMEERVQAERQLAQEYAAQANQETVRADQAQEEAQDAKEIAADTSKTASHERRKRKKAEAELADVRQQRDVLHVRLRKHEPEADLDPETQQDGGGYRTLTPAEAETFELLQQTLRCAVCNRRWKDTILTKCLHMFCHECIDANMRNRNRKCPACGVKYSQNQVQKAQFTY